MKERIDKVVFIAYLIRAFMCLLLECPFQRLLSAFKSILLRPEKRSSQPESHLQANSTTQETRGPALVGSEIRGAYSLRHDAAELRALFDNNLAIRIRNREPRTFVLERLLKVRSALLAEAVLPPRAYSLLLVAGVVIIRLTGSATFVVDLWLCRPVVALGMKDVFGVAHVWFDISVEDLFNLSAESS
jgi:hypothetical protein